MFSVTKGRKVRIGGVEYTSASEASRQLDLKLPTVYTRLMSQTAQWKDWYYSDGLPTPVVKRGKVKHHLYCCYLFEHLPTGKTYVGSTVDFSSRKACHLHDLRKGRHSCSKLQSLYDQDSNLDNWKWILVVCNGRLHMFEVEQQLIDNRKDTGLLLNTSLEAMSPIVHNLKDPLVAAKRLEALKSSFRTNRPVIAKRISEGMKSRWELPGAKESIRGGGNPFAKKVKVDGVVYGSVKDAQAALGINEKTIRKRANSPEYPNYSFNVA